MTDSSAYAANPPVDRGVALRIINELRSGKPPREYVSVIHVGDVALLKYFREKLDELKQYGTSDVKFVNADYGRGKSHFLDLIRLIGFEYNFVVSHIELNQRSVPFDRLEDVAKSIMSNIATAEFRESGFEKLLQQWARQLRGRGDRVIQEALEPIPMPQLRLHLADYAKAYNYDPPEQHRMLQHITWFRGEETKSRTFTSVQEYLHALTKFFRTIGYSGFIIMVDEAEAISSLTRGNRGEVANENIRQIIDNAQGTEGFYFVFASTPTFFEAPAGGIPRPGDPVTIYSYPALRRRVENLLNLMDPRSPDSVVVELPDLTEENYLKLAQKIRSLSAQAYGDPPTAIDDSELLAVVRYVRSIDSRVATMVRSLVAVCDRARQPGFSFRDSFEMMVEREREQVDRQASQ